VAGATYAYTPGANRSVLEGTGTYIVRT
jgi:hypothetical protein